MCLFKVCLTGVAIVAATATDLTPVILNALDANGDGVLSSNEWWGFTQALSSYNLEEYLGAIHT